jgi:hypothetical protein
MQGGSRGRQREGRTEITMVMEKEIPQGAL